MTKQEIEKALEARFGNAAFLSQGNIRDFTNWKRDSVIDLCAGLPSIGNGRGKRYWYQDVAEKLCNQGAGYRTERRKVAHVAKV